MPDNIVTIPYHITDTLAWYETNTDVLDRFNVKIESPHSRIKGGIAYLDHATDGAVFLSALRKTDVKIKFRNNYRGERCFIQNL